MDQFSNSFINYEANVEKSAINEHISSTVDENEYIFYDEIERTWEVILMDKRLMCILKLN